MRAFAKGLSLVVALLVLGLGVLGSLVVLVLSLGSAGGRATDRLEANTIALSLFVLAVGLGGSLAWSAWQALRGQPSSTARPPVLGVLAGGWLLSVGLGLGVASLPIAGPWIFPPFYVLSMGLPPLMILFWVARQVQRKGWSVRGRDLILGLSQGGFVATTVALLGELLVVGLLIAIGALLFNLKLLNLGSLGDLRQQLRSGNIEALAPLLSNPAVLLVGAVVLMGVGPLLEELGKGLTPLWLSYRRPGVAQALLWGVAGGAGFAIVEGLFNGATGIPNFGFAVASRVAATVMHTLGGGLTGMAWWYGLNRQPWRALGLFLSAVLMHGLWNGSAGALTVLGLQTAVGLGSARSSLWAGAGTLFFVALIALLLITAATALVLITVRLPRRELAVGS